MPLYDHAGKLLLRLTIGLLMLPHGLAKLFNAVSYTHLRAHET